MKNRKIFSRVTLVTVLALSLALFAVGGTLAWLVSATQPITNTFTLGIVDVDIVEEYDYTQKTVIKIANPPKPEDKPENVDAYVRVALVPVIVDGSGNIQGETVTLDELNLDIDDNFWLVGNDGYYYYSTILPVEGITENLLKNPVNLFDDEQKTVRLDVIADAVQAYPSSAVISVWTPAVQGVNAADGTLILAGGAS